MRSEFAAVGVAGVVLGGALLGGAGDALAETPAEPPVTHAFVLDGAPVSLLYAAHGNEPGTLKLTNEYVKKHIGNIKYNDFSLKMGLAMGQPVKDWIKTSLDGSYLRKSGEIRALDLQQKATAVRSFTNALITEIAFPACDGGSKDPAYLTLKFAPETVEYKPAGKLDVATLAAAEKAKRWTARNFKLEIATFRDASAGAVKIAPLTITLGGPVAPGQPRAPHKVSNLIVTMPPPPELAKWASDGTTRDGRLEYRTDDGAVLYAFALRNIKPVRVIVQSQSNRPMVELELQSQSIELAAPAR